MLMSALTLGWSFPFQPDTRRFSTNPSILEATDDFSENIQIELISTKKRALDVKIFRQLSITPAEYILKREEDATDGELLISEDEAIDLLMPGYDEQGNYIKYVSPHGHEVYFAAICSRRTKSGEDVPNQLYARQNGIVGVVRAQIKNLGSSTTLENVGEDMENLPPHVYLSNMSVHDSQRRQGVGTTLLSSVTSYARSQADVNLVLLGVDNDNSGAIRMYEKHGYKYLDQDEEIGTMFKYAI